MKIISLGVNNFRQFYGEQKVDFSQNSNQLVTVIHGENGSGKTAFLNAFKWVLYGKTDFDTKKKLINERFLAESDESSEMQIGVALEFEHERKKYTAKRIQKYRKIEKLKHREIGDSVFELSYFDDTGEFINSPNASTHIKQIIPENLHPYFFFNGERIDKLANEASAEEIKIAIKKLLGLEILERAESHLQKHVIRSLRKKLKDVSSSDLNEKIDLESDIRDKQDSFKQKIGLLNKNLSEYTKELQLIDQSLDGKKEISRLHKERTTLELRSSKLKEKLKTIYKRRRMYVSNNGYLAFTADLLTSTKKILEDKRKKGELPSNIKQQFIKDLIDRKSCICGRELIPGTESYDLIQEFLNKAVPQDVEDAFIKTSAAIQGMLKSRKVMFSRIKDYQNNISEMLEELNTNKAKIDEITNKIGNVKSEPIEKLESKRIELKEKIDDFKYKLKVIKQRDIPETETRLNNVRKEIKEIKAKNEKQKLAQKRLDQSIECKRVISAIHEAISDKMRKELSESVNKTFSDIMRKDYWAEIGTDYSLDIYKKVGDHQSLVYEKSTGENQVASLSFISSLVAICKENYEMKKNKFLKGGIFPIIMDSPYGTLDKEYRSLVAKLIPDLADQIIVLLSDSQWSGEVEDELLPRVGKHYTLIYHSPHINASTSSKSVRKSEKYEYTEIMEGNYGR